MPADTKKIIIEQSTGKKYLIKNSSENFHTSSGMIAHEDLISKRSIISSNIGRKFFLFTPSFPDLWENINRGPQIMLHKDIGLIIAKTGINRGSKIVDAGGGSGSLCLSLANICKEAIVYENHPKHYEILTKNKQLFKMNNLILKQEDIYAGIAEKGLDLITLDLPEPWRVIEHAEKSLKNGAFLVVYLPNLIQVKTFIDSTTGTSIKVMETIELMERKWKIEDKIMRPEFQMLGHTGFLTFCRKYTN